MAESQYVIGVDFGTDSVRSIIVNGFTGEEVSSAVSCFKRWGRGLYCMPEKNLFRQHPLDYIEGLETSIQEAVQKAPRDVAEKIMGISVDTTGSTPVAVNRNGVPLSLTPEFEENPNAMFVLWKDHTAVKEAAEINHLARTWGGEDYTRFVGGVYSSEWFWAKILHILREDEDVRNAGFSWVEHCDWIPALLTGQTDPLQIKRSRCAAGHKAMWHADFGGLPSETFLSQLDPLLTGLRERLYKDTFACDVQAGKLSKEWAGRLGLSEEVIVGVGAFDAHLGAIGGGIQPYILCKIIGTSTCDMLIAPMAEMENKLIKGICGQVDGSIIPGMLGMEAGQSAFGDIYAWFKDLLMWPIENVLSKNEKYGEETQKLILQDITEKLIPELLAAAEKIPIDESGIVVLDWMNGRRTPNANQLLKGTLAGLNLASDPPRIFRALVEATAFGARKIVDCFLEEGVPIQGVIALGGIPKKAPFVMQVLADVLNMPINVARSDQAVALGSAMAAATVAGLYSTIEKAQKAMSNGFETEYTPDPDHAGKYESLYTRYAKLGNFIESEFS